MYGEKVMEHFKHPHNYGEMKNADAVGKVGNPVCLIGGTMIHANDHFVPIEGLNTGCSVLSHDGRFSHIMRTIRRNYSGTIIELKNKLGKIALTPEHEVFAVKLPKEHKYLYYKNKKLLLPAWYHAAELKKGDLSAYPMMKEEKDTKFIYIGQERKKYDFRSRKIPEKIRVNGPFLRLCGYYLAEGYLKEKVTKTYLGFAFNTNESDLVKDAVTTIKKVFGTEAKVKTIQERKTIQVTVNNVWVVRLFKREFGKGAEAKTIPNWIMLLPPKRQIPLVYGLWKGDGYFNERKPRAGYSTISYQLAQKVKTLLLRQRIIPSVYSEKEKIVDGVKHRKAYRLHVGDRPSLERLAKILDIHLKISKPLSIDSWFDGNYLFVPITTTNKEEYYGEVFNLEVENSKSYVADSFAIHNCGDLMYIYIKVGKNKKGGEIIEDIKFQTFGCVAAIANSSMLTDLVKGKTLEEAEKLTKEDLLKKLGKMPAIKYHCSVLAVDGLHDAVKKYRESKKKK